MEHFPDKTAFV